MAKVKKIIDGDTFMTNSGERIRLAEVDAPERGAPYSAQATEHLADLIEDKNVQVKKVAKDQYGRTIANVTVGGLDVNRGMKSFLTRRKKR